VQGEKLGMIEPLTQADWAEWLAENHATSRGTWVAVHKKAQAAGRLDYEQMVEEALRFGWIDSTVRKLDEERFAQLMTPRRANSGWAPSNKARVERLIAQGRMAPAGLAAVESAKANGSWSTLDSVEALEVPDDLALALAQADACAQFELLAPSQRKMALYWISEAKRPATRATRIEKTVAAALLGKPPF
jgi:uncharacterized protein YdeI (YjbR/CyaY-like superfamily)